MLSPYSFITLLLLFRFYFIFASSGLSYPLAMSEFFLETFGFLNYLFIVIRMERVIAVVSIQFQKLVEGDEFDEPDDDIDPEEQLQEEIKGLYTKVIALVICFFSNMLLGTIFFRVYEGTLNFTNISFYQREPNHFFTYRFVLL